MGSCLNSESFDSLAPVHFALSASHIYVARTRGAPPVYLNSRPANLAVSVRQRPSAAPPSSLETKTDHAEDAVHKPDYEPGD
jgi:hypothetical protein